MEFERKSVEILIMNERVPYLDSISFSRKGKAFRCQSTHQNFSGDLRFYFFRQTWNRRNNKFSFFFVLFWITNTRWLDNYKQLRNGFLRQTNVTKPCREVLLLINHFSFLLKLFFKYYYLLFFYSFTLEDISNGRCRFEKKELSLSN